MKRLFVSTVMALTALSLLALPTQAAPPEHAQVNRLLAQVRQATVQYRDVAVAEADGYVQVSPCVPMMGFHFQRGLAMDEGDLDPLSPEILVYAPRPHGGLKLVAVEYASDVPAELFGVTFDPPAGGPPFHTLHAWVWQGNPDGMFAAHNPNVSCG